MRKALTEAQTSASLAATEANSLRQELTLAQDTIRRQVHSTFAEHSLICFSILPSGTRARDLEFTIKHTWRQSISYGERYTILGRLILRRSPTTPTLPAS